MIVRFCYAVYLQLLNQHNPEFRPWSPDPLSRGAREGSGNETRLSPNLKRKTSYSDIASTSPHLITVVFG